MSRTTIHEEIQVLDNDIMDVWLLISNFAGVASWAPTVSECTTDGHGIGSVRTVIESGIKFQEKLDIHDEESHTISYRILDPTPFPMGGSRGTIQLERLAAGTCQLTWTADAESIDDAGMKIISPVMSEFIKTSINGLKGTLAKASGSSK